MPRVAVTTPYFDFFPELKAELAATYPGSKFRSERRPLSENELIAYLAGYDTAVIGLDRFTDRVCAALPDLKVISLCSAGVDHIDPAILKKHGKRMWWAAGINKVSVSELAVCYMVLALRRVHFFSSVLARGQWKGAMEPANGNPLLDVPNFFGSPHIGATTRESWEAMLRSGIRGIEEAYEPQPGVYPFD